MKDIEPLVSEILPDLVEFRHDLHMHPELGYEETRTSARVLEQLEALPGLDIRTGLAGTGIVATLNGHKQGRCVALRADMDALPIQEANTFDYRSRHDGKMHACGHDGHTACLVGAARVLSRIADTVPGKVKFIFQPAEETGAGGKKIVEEGALDDPPADAVFAMHGWPDNKLGEVVVGEGSILAAISTFDIELSGVGAHAAFPHCGQDLIVTASHIVTAIQALASRFTDPIEPVVVSVTSVQMGNTYNVLPDHGHMMGTARAMQADTHQRLSEELKRIVESTASMFGASARIDWQAGYPPLINDPKAASFATRVARELVGDEAVITDPPQCMGGEDFAYYAAKAPTVMFRLGVCPTDRDEYPKVHHPNYDFNDDAVSLGVLMHCRLAHEFLAEGFG